MGAIDGTGDLNVFLFYDQQAARTNRRGHPFERCLSIREVHENAPAVHEVVLLVEIVRGDVVATHGQIGGIDGVHKLNVDIGCQHVAV
jgi:hypothetical protein